MDIENLRKEIKDDFKELKGDLSEKIDVVNSNLVKIIDELKTIADGHTKTLADHSVAIANLMLEREQRPSKHCLKAVEIIVEEKITFNNEKLLNAHREHHINEGKEKLNLVSVGIRIITGIIAIWGAISAYIIIGGQ
jgi:hypothetical protein